MSPRGKIYHPDYALELLDIAAGDLASARGLAKIAEGRPENICYMAQQCVEKKLRQSCEEALERLVAPIPDLDAGRRAGPSVL
jgi:hypothetical protein